MNKKTKAAIFNILLIGAAAATPTANAGLIAVFGDNGIDDYIDTLPGYSATLVNDADLQLAGSLDAFDAFVYTRNSASGSPNPLMSAASAANVSGFVDGNIVLFNGDYSDSVGGEFSSDPVGEQLFANALAFAVAGGGGYIGELFGFAAAFDSNASGVPALGLVSGDVLGNFSSDDGAITLTAAGTASAITAGAGLPADVGDWALSYEVTGFDAGAVLAEHPSGRPAILAFGQPVAQPVPAPATVTLLAAGLLLRRRLV